MVSPRGYMHRRRSTCDVPRGRRRNQSRDPDAIAAANSLAAPLRENRVTDKDLHGVQQRRAWPTKMTQLLQLFLQKRVIGRVLHGKGGKSPVSPPFFFRLLARFPFLGWIPARLIGIGFRPEHVHTPDVWNDRRSPRGERANYH